MIVTLWHEPSISPVLSIGVVIGVLGEEEAAKESELGRVHRFFINYRLASLEEVFIVWAENVLVQWDATRCRHCVVDMETISVGHFLIVLMRYQFANVPDLMHLFETRACLSVCILHRHENEQHTVVVLVDELVQELSSLLEI